MKNWLISIYLNRYFLLLILLLGNVKSVYIRVIANQEINSYPFIPKGILLTLFQAGLLFVIIQFFIDKWQKSDVLNSKVVMLISSSSILVFLFVLTLFGLLVYFVYSIIDLNFNVDTFFSSMFSDFLNGFIYGSFFLAYYYHKKSKNHQIPLANYQKAVSESKIYQLKVLLNPHVLSNNLNVLDQFIKEVQHKAFIYFNEFTEIYRYVLRATYKKIISIIDQLQFVEQYLGLTQYRYGNDCQMKIDYKNDIGFNLPLALVTLIENAVLQILRTVENSGCMNIHVDENIIATYNVKLKNLLRTTNGRALNNLIQQYKIFTNKQLEIMHKGNEYTVIIPIIHTG